MDANLLKYLDFEWEQQIGLMFLHYLLLGSNRAWME